MVIRMKDWKVVLMEQCAKTLQCWFEPLVRYRAPKMFNLRRDPFERADENSNTVVVALPALALVLVRAMGPEMHGPGCWS
jgi:hypothetical protein